MVRLVLALGFAALLVGCGGGESTPPESATSKQMATDAASRWTPEAQAAFKKAHERAGKGEDE